MSSIWRCRIWGEWECSGSGFSKLLPLLGAEVRARDKDLEPLAEKGTQSHESGRDHLGQVGREKRNRDGSLGKAGIKSSPAGDSERERVRASKRSWQAERGQQDRMSQNSQQSTGRCPWISQLGQQKMLYFFKGNQKQRKWKEKRMAFFM